MYTGQTYSTRTHLFLFLHVLKITKKKIKARVLLFLRISDLSAAATPGCLLTSFILINKMSASISKVILVFTFPSRPQTN